MDATRHVADLYRHATREVRPSFGQVAHRALAYYAPLLRFISNICPPSRSTPPRLLDVGCGSGWSTYAFARQGYQAVGLDVNPHAFEPPWTAGCTLQRGSVTAIPFEAESFDIVVAYQCLEHVATPARALDEMARVCKAGGVVAIVGPNLVSPLPGLMYLCKPSSWRSLQLFRSPATPRHPYGNTVPEIVAASMLRTWQLLRKLFQRTPTFLMRSPDHDPPFHADNDACYLCTPLDVITYLRMKGLGIERKGRPRRPPLAYLIAGGTWVAARKPPPGAEGLAR